MQIEMVERNFEFFWSNSILWSRKRTNIELFLIRTFFLYQSHSPLQPNTPPSNIIHSFLESLDWYWRSRFLILNPRRMLFARTTKGNDLYKLYPRRYYRANTIYDSAGTQLRLYENFQKHIS